MSWLFERFEQCIGGAFRHGLRLFKNHQTPRRLKRLTGEETTQVPNLLKSHLRRCPPADPDGFSLGAGDQTPLMAVGGLHPQQIRMIAVLKTPSFTGNSHTSAQDSLKEAKSSKPTTHAIRTTEQIGGGKTMVLQSSTEELFRKRLALQIGEQHGGHSSPSAVLSLSTPRIAC